jgi:hypothetical protein
MQQMSKLDEFILRGIGVSFPCICALDAYGLLPLNYADVNKFIDKKRNIDHLSREMITLSEISNITDDSLTLSNVVYKKTYNHKVGCSILIGKVGDKVVSVYHEDNDTSHRYELDLLKGIVNVLVYGDVSHEPLFKNKLIPIFKCRIKSRSIEPLLSLTDLELVNKSFSTGMYFNQVQDELEKDLMSATSFYGDDYEYDSYDLPDKTHPVLVTYIDGKVTRIDERGQSVLYVTRMNEEKTRLSICRSTLPKTLDY